MEKQLSFINVAIAYGVSLVIFLGIDMLWLQLIAKSFYADKLGGLINPKPSLLIALFFYILYPVGITVFTLIPALKTGSWTTALGLGALLGFIAYMTYDITNLVTLKGWPVTVTLVDIVWGTIVTAATALATYFLTSLVK